MWRSVYCGLTVSVFFLFVLTAAVSRAEIVMQHLGANDPTTEGWTAGGPIQPAGINAPVINELGTGIDAWALGNTEPGSLSRYYVNVLQDLDLKIQRNAVQYGWTFKENLRIVNTPDDPSGSVWTVVSMPTQLSQLGNLPIKTSFFMYFGAEANGDPIVGFQGTQLGMTFVDLNGLGGGYHLYELSFNPSTKTTDFYVDGSIVVSDLAGRLGTNSLIDWGVYPTDTDVGQGNYNLIQLDVVPEPATVVLLAIGGVIALAASRHHRCQLCGKEVVNDANELPSGWAHLAISRLPDGSAQTALLCDLCSTKGEAAVWVLGRRQRKDQDKP